MPREVVDYTHMRVGFLKKAIHVFGRWYCSELCKREYESQSFNRRNERPIEFRFVFNQLLKTSPRTVLDVGTGKTALPHLMRNCGLVVTAIDNISDYWPRGMFNRHFYVINDDITRTKLKRTFDFITCVSVLEHIRAHDDAVAKMFSLVNPGGYIALTFPYNENGYIEDVYRLPDAGYGRDFPYICQVFSRKELDRWVRNNEGALVEQEYWQMFSGEFWTFGEILRPPMQVEKRELHQLSCVLLRRSGSPLTEGVFT